MPDNSAEIARLNAILSSGVKSGMADGEAATFDPESIRRRISQLQRTDTAGRRLRPIASTINLGGLR